MPTVTYRRPTENLHQSAQHATAGNRIHYGRYRPEQTVLYQPVQEHIESFFAQVKTETGSGLPDFGKDEFDAFLECGILAHGFLRLRCADCPHEKLVAFSCKRRGFCPSCGGRRMAQTAAHLVDHLIPRVAVRQRVLSLPIPLRYLLVAHPRSITPVLEVIHRAISISLIKQAGLKRSETQTGAITCIERFGPAANLNIHLHCLVLDGVCHIQNGVAKFHSARSPTAEQLQSLLSQIIKHIMKTLTRNGALIEKEGMSYLAERETDATLVPLQSAGCTYRIALGRRAGQKVLTLKTAPTQNVQPQPHKKYCVNAHGFSLHASVRCAMNQRKELKHLCRYITRPAIANERLTCNAAGQVVLALKTPYRDGTTHIAMPPLEFMQQLAALVLRPRLNLICSNGVLAPNAKLRAEIIPGEKKGKSTPSDANDNAPHSAATKRISWARLLRRVFNINIEQSQLSVHLKLMGKAVYFSYTHLVLASTLTLASTAAAQTDPLLSGTFVQLNPQLIGLGPDGWRAELAHMRAIGMDTLIVQYSRYGDVAYFPTGEATDAGNVLPPNESVATLVWQAPVGATARHLRVTVTPDSREWTMIPEVRVLSGGQNAAAGLGYALAPAPASNYLDPNAASGGKLTDGFANFAWSDMVGWQRLGENIIIDFDLGDVTALEAVEVDFMRSDVFNVDLPASISVSVSGDGGNFLPLGRPVTWGEEASSPDRSTWNPLSDLIGAAEEFGFEVWLGLSLDPAYWQGSFDPEASSTANIALMHTLEKLYGSSPAVVGYYLPEEIDDRSFVSESAHAAMTQYLAAMADAAHMIGRLVMVAPYFGMNPDGEAYAAWWDTTLQAADIDVITMQDGVGTRRTTVAQGVPVFRALKEVTDRHGVAFWSDLEVFEQTHGWPVDDLVWQAQPATIESVIEQLELEAPFVEKFVVFDFTHYMSPRLGGASAELYDAYADYLEAYREKGSR